MKAKPKRFGEKNLYPVRTGLGVMTSTVIWTGSSTTIADHVVCDGDGGLNQRLFYDFVKSLSRYTREEERRHLLASGNFLWFIFICRLKFLLKDL